MSEEDLNLEAQVEYLRSRSQEITDIIRNFHTVDNQESRNPEISQIFSNITESTNSRTMLTLNIDPLKYLNKLHPFNGDSRELQNFIDLIDRIHPILAKYDDLGQCIFSDIIKSKLVGKAREVAEINAHITSWDDMKTMLINNFGDRLTIEDLFDELRAAKFKTNSVEFYNEIKTILRRLNTKTKTEYQANNILMQQTITANKESALNIFKNKLPEPMRSILYCRKPHSLEESIKILHESGYAFYSAPQTRTYSNNPPQNNNQNLPNNRNRHNRDQNIHRSGRNQPPNQSSQHYQGNSPHSSNQPFNPRNNQNTSTNPKNDQRMNRHNNFQQRNQYNPNHYQNPNRYPSNSHPNNAYPNYNYQNPRTYNNSNSYTNNQYPPSPQPTTNTTNVWNSNSNNNSNKLPPPEPMEINANIENTNFANTEEGPQNFRSTASEVNYHIS